MEYVSIHITIIVENHERALIHYSNAAHHFAETISSLTFLYNVYPFLKITLVLKTGLNILPACAFELSTLLFIISQHAVGVVYQFYITPDWVSKP